MALPASGAISLGDIQTEFARGGANPISLSEYYKNGSYVLSNDTAPNVPTSGAISFSNFYGATANFYDTSPRSQMFGAPTVTSNYGGTVSWTRATGIMIGSPGYAVNDGKGGWIASYVMADENQFGTAYKLNIPPTATITGYQVAWDSVVCNTYTAGSYVNFTGQLFYTGMASTIAAGLSATINLATKSFGAGASAVVSTWPSGTTNANLIALLNGTITATSKIVRLVVQFSNDDMNVAPVITITNPRFIVTWT